MNETYNSKTSEQTHEQKPTNCNQFNLLHV